MKANQFIKEFGLRLAKLALAEIHLSDDDGLLRAYKCPKCYTLIVDENTNGHYGCKFCDGNDAELVSFKVDCIDELKRLTESHELVEKMGGLEACKQKIKEAKLIPKDRFICFVDKEDSEVHGYVLKQAIADVESCQ